MHGCFVVVTVVAMRPLFEWAVCFSAVSFGFFLKSTFCPLFRKVNFENKNSLRIMVALVILGRST